MVDLQQTPDGKYNLPLGFTRIEGMIDKECFRTYTHASNRARIAFMKEHGYEYKNQDVGSQERFFTAVRNMLQSTGYDFKNRGLTRKPRILPKPFQYKKHADYAFSPTTTTWKIAQMNGRVNAIDGGARAGKTNSILELFVSWAHANPGLIFLMGSESMPHMTGGVIQETQLIMEDWGLWDTAGKHVASSVLNTYRWNNGSKFLFTSLDKPSKFRGPSPDFVLINEYNSPLISFETFQQLFRRVKRAIYMDCNPDVDTWFDNEVLPNPHHYKLDHLTEVTYKDNEALTPAQITGILADKVNPVNWAVYGEGKKGSTKDMVYPGWTTLKNWSDRRTIPPNAKLRSRGLDFGGDGGENGSKMAMVAIYEWLGGWIIDEEVWSPNYDLDQLVTFLKKVSQQCTIFADSAGKQSIARLRREGFAVLPVQKGDGSIADGISFVRRQKVFITASSAGLRYEQRRYRFKKDPNGRNLRNPSLHLQDDGMDAVRYGFEPMMPKELSYEAEALVNSENQFDPWVG